MNVPGVLMRLGNICSILVWIPFAALMVNAVLSGGKIRYASIEAIIEAPFFQLGFWLILLIIFMAGAAVFFVSGAIAGKRAYRQIVKKGQDAEAKILSLKDTGTRINNSPLVNISLEVQPTDLPSFSRKPVQRFPFLNFPFFNPAKPCASNTSPVRRRWQLSGLARLEIDSCKAKVVAASTVTTPETAFVKGLKLSTTMNFHK